MNSEGTGSCERTLDALVRIGFEKAECTLMTSGTEELNLEGGEISLLRTTDDISLTMSGIRGERKGSLTLNRLDPASISDGASRLVGLTDSSEPDPAYDISPSQPAGKWARGPESPDLEKMYDRMLEFREYTREDYPSLILRRASVTFESTEIRYMNSNGVDLASRVGCYRIKPLFASKRGRATSSFNYASVASASLDKPLWEYGSLDLLMKQSGQQVDSTAFRGKFRGDVIITPECMQEFVDMICLFLGDRLMVRGTSIFRNSLGSSIADSSLTLESLPLSEDLPACSFITSDGFAAGNSTLIEKGVLKDFVLSLYGSNKTGLGRSASGGGYYVIEPGESSLEEIMKQVNRGILLCRFSGGSPSASGDFSGVAKNSYYIEDGRIEHPVREVMISGHIREMLMNIRGLSRERVNLGYSVMPWIRIGEVSIFGKH